MPTCCTGNCREGRACPLRKPFYPERVIVAKLRFAKAYIGHWLEFGDHAAAKRTAELDAKRREKEAAEAQSLALSMEEPAPAGHDFAMGWTQLGLFLLFWAAVAFGCWAGAVFLPIIRSYFQ